MKAFVKGIEVLAVLIFSFEASALSYVVKAPQTPFSEFISYLQTESSFSYAQKQADSLRENFQFEQEDMLSLLEQAQESFLKDHLKNSSEIFHSITQKAYEKDWSEEVRKIIFYSFLRLAQIEGKGEFPDSFIHSAVVFAFDLSPDETLFPPPLVEKLNEIKEKLPQLSFRLGKIFPNHEIVFINGKKHSLNEEIRLPYGNYRVTALSSSHQAWSQVISLSELIRKKVTTASWVRGKCEFPDVSQSVQSYEVLFPHSCIWKASPNDKSIQTQNLEKVLKADHKPSFDFKKHSKWFWIGGGIGIAVITLVVLNSRNSNTPPQPPPPQPPSRPTQTIGF